MTLDHRCKIADFGLARLVHEEEGNYQAVRARDLPVRMDDTLIMLIN